MRFRIEQIQLTDPQGKALPSARDVTFHILEAGSAEEAIAQFLDTDRAALVGGVLTFPGFVAVATGRRENVVYTLQVLPVTDRLVVR
jgi:hypothetical protein